ncbi:hypothetical protein BpHYR1_018401 [Brachionus plicatilis]|uniref:Uncharacterized protein n=1 Tax=Brachionus plicatilis TaxID=10195 RepID=A0A3M7P6Y5_BRAPC|nr:hypothetical protein BpHYR1_018401 [Brachionus plicatilis]
MEADIFHKRDVMIFAFSLIYQIKMVVDKSRLPLTGLDFYTPPEPLNRSPIYSSGSNKQPDYNYPLSDAGNFKSASLSSFLEGKSRFNHQETKSLPIFSNNLIRKDMMRPIHYKNKNPLNSGLKDKTEYPMKLPDFEDEQLNKSVSIEYDQEETLREPQNIEKEKNGLKNDSAFSMIEMEKCSPAKSIEKSKKENEQLKKKNEEKNKKRENENENEKKKDKQEEKEKKENEEAKNTKNSKNKEKSRNFHVYVFLCWFLLDYMIDLLFIDCLTPLKLTKIMCKNRCDQFM